MTTDAIEFDIIQESWNEYELDDGTAILRLRAIPVRIRPLDGGKFHADLMNVLVVAATTPGVRGAPNPMTPTATRTPVHCAPISEPANLYRIRAGGRSRRVSIRLSITSVARVEGAFDGEGEPIYEVHTQVAVTDAGPHKEVARR